MYNGVMKWVITILDRLVFIGVASSLPKMRLVAV